jgi:hypothetical protein
VGILLCGIDTTNMWETLGRACYKKVGTMGLIVLTKDWVQKEGLVLKLKFCVDFSISTIGKLLKHVKLIENKDNIQNN